jgi:hypothetical protein
MNTFRPALQDFVWSLGFKTSSGVLECRFLWDAHAPRQLNHSATWNNWIEKGSGSARCQPIRNAFHRHALIQVIQTCVAAAAASGSCSDQSRTGWTDSAVKGGHLMA